MILCLNSKGYITENITIYEPVADYCQKGPGKRFYNYISLDRKRKVDYKCLNNDQRRFGPEILRNGLKIFSSNSIDNNLV